MRIESKLLKASFVARVNRFAALVRLEGSDVLVHVPNSGRLRELFTPGRTVYLASRPNHNRKTSYDLLLVGMDNLLVSCDARLPTSLVEEALHSGKISPFQGYPTIEREVSFRNSRLDLRLSGPNGHCFLETKSVTLIVDGAALFPDAPTTRGKRHLQSLMQAVEEGHRAAIVFVIQREDATQFRPNDGADNEFAAVLRQAAACGVGVYAYTCHVSQTDLDLAREVSVLL